ncbi:Uncharacterised protein [Kluyvera cryocrescens]|uniref:Uncharacterized protein n=1 Tax=Kluyvera cryocrescens TaxID=580 RepID=A0A485CRI8_KLUCR|nr:Uncharacterised protein [Kluyvera cryocrescens]
MYYDVRDNIYRIDAIMMDDCPPFTTPQVKRWISSPDDSMKELPQSVYFRSYVLAANNHVDQHRHAFAQFHFARKGSMRIDVAGKCWGDPRPLWNLDPA